MSCPPGWAGASDWPRQFAWGTQVNIYTEHMRPYLLEERRGRVAISKFTLFPYLKNVGIKIEMYSKQIRVPVPTTKAWEVSVNASM